MIKRCAYDRNTRSLVEDSDGAWVKFDDRLTEEEKILIEGNRMAFLSFLQSQGWLSSEQKKELRRKIDSAIRSSVDDSEERKNLYFLLDTQVFGQEANANSNSLPQTRSGGVDGKDVGSNNPSSSTVTLPTSLCKCEHSLLKHGSAFGMDGAFGVCVMCFYRKKKCENFEEVKK